MTAGSALACPNCRRVLETHSWHDDASGVCRRCGTAFEFLAFPAFTARASRVAAQAAELDAESVCFFHAGNRAEAICEECGRLLCPVCTVSFAGKKMCPTCVAATRASEAANVVGQRTLFDGIALTVAALPLLVWPITLVTAPVAIGVVIYGWNKPGSLVRRRTRLRLVIAAVIATLEIAAWATAFAFIWLR